LGVATTRLEERLLASLGQLQAAPVRFEAVQDVPGGGVLRALPALLALGLLRRRQENFSLPPGYYPVETIFLVIAFLALARVKSVEALRYEPPGEWGKIVGLDRIPEVRTLREKLQRGDDARALARQIFESAVDLRPDLEKKTLGVSVHGLSSPAHDTALAHLCAELNASETTYPGTELRLVFEPVGTARLPRDQES
jgi:hypothetical protein